MNSLCRTVRRSNLRRCDETCLNRFNLPIGFHGTPEAFDRFEMFSLGVHFSTGWRVAQQFAGGPDGWIIAARLSIRRPLRMPDLATWEVRDLVANALDRGGLTVTQADALDALITEARYDDGDFHRALATNGFDSIVYDNRVEGGGDSFIVFHPRHIRVLERRRIGQNQFRPKSERMR